jgi:putative addiction module component (TIGR02574 family)
MDTQTLIDEVIALPVEQRSQVVESILASLNQPNSDIDKQWIKVAKKRLAEMESDKSQTINSDEVFAKIFKRLE